MGKKEIEIKGTLSLEEAIRYLQELSSCLMKGRVVVQKGAEYLEMHPCSQVELELEAEQKKGLEKISLELSWRSGLLERPASDLHITYDPPAAPPSCQSQPGATTGERPEETEGGKVEGQPAEAAPEKLRSSRGGRRQP